MEAAKATMNTVTATPAAIHSEKDTAKKFGSSLFVQRKLTIGSPDDPLEKEADDMADKVMRMEMPSPIELSSAKNSVHRKCAHCEEEEKQVQRKESSNDSVSLAPSIVHNVINSSGGRSLDADTRSFMEPRFNYDFSNVKIHDNDPAAKSAGSINALAYTSGNNIVFNTGQYNTSSDPGKRLLAHELTHVVQQNSDNSCRTQVQKAAIFNDTTCGDFQSNIEAAWPTAGNWTRLAVSQLNDASNVSGLLTRHFKIDPSDQTHQADLQIVKQAFNEMLALFDTDIVNRCVEAQGGTCHLAPPDGREYAAYVHRGTPNDGIWHCKPYTDRSLLTRASLIETLVHEVAHLTTLQVTDHAYGDNNRTLARNLAIRNADCYSKFAQDVYLGSHTTPYSVSLSPGLLLSSAGPQFVIRANFELGTRSGLEVFDLVGGLHLWFGTDGTRYTLGESLDIGILSRSPETHFFADTRIGVFASTDESANARIGISPSVVIGWANSGFRAGVEVRPLFDFLHGEHAMIVGGELGFQF